jgi:hypothetical protein
MVNKWSLFLVIYWRYLKVKNTRVIYIIKYFLSMLYISFHNKQGNKFGPAFVGCLNIENNKICIIEWRYDSTSYNEEKNVIYLKFKFKNQLISTKEVFMLIYWFVDPWFAL